MGYLGTIVSVFAPRFLVFLAYLAGLIFAIVHREKHPRISFLASISFGILTLVSLIDALILVTPIFSRGIIDISVSQLGTITLVHRFTSSFLEAGSVVLLVFAIFGGRADLDVED